VKLSYAGNTDVGRKRAHNEDNFILMPDESLFVVCDGMGGHASGEVASQIAVDTIREFYTDTGKDKDKTWPYKESHKQSYEANRLITSIRLGNNRVHEQSNSAPQYKGMGTTCVAMLFRKGVMVVAHVGDSRAYRVREGEIIQLTEDHSLLNDYKKMTNMTPEEEENFQYKNIIVRALGMKDDVLVDTNEYKLQEGDIYIACSDGLNGEITDTEILAITEQHIEDTEAVATRLIDAANLHGGKDNVTVAVVRVDPD